MDPKTVDLSAACTYSGTALPILVRNRREVATAGRMKKAGSVAFINKKLAFWRGGILVTSYFVDLETRFTKFSSYKGSSLTLNLYS